MNKKLRLLITEDCPRACPGCCNKQWDLKALPNALTFSKYSEILITGGEPLLYPKYLEDVLQFLRTRSGAYIYIYTAIADNLLLDLIVTRACDGFTITIHTEEDRDRFVAWYDDLARRDHISRLFDIGRHGSSISWRLNVFKEAKFRVSKGAYLPFVVKNGIEWIKDCPLPEGEEFMRFNHEDFLDVWSFREKVPWHPVPRLGSKKAKKAESTATTSMNIPNFSIPERFWAIAREQANTTMHLSAIEAQRAVAAMNTQIISESARRWRLEGDRLRQMPRGSDEPVPVARVEPEDQAAPEPDLSPGYWSPDPGEES